MRAAKLLSVVASLVALIPTSLLQAQITKNAADDASQQAPEQYLRSLFYRGDSAVMERDGEAIVSKKDASLEVRAWYVSQAQFGKPLITALALVDGMKKQAPDDAWTLAARTYFVSETEMSISLCEKATAKDPRPDILFLCTRGVSSQINMLGISEQRNKANAELLKKFVERHSAMFEASAQGLVAQASALRQVNFAIDHKQYSDETATLYERALKLDPANEAALAGKISDLVGRKKYKEAADSYEKFPVPIDSQEPHLTYWYFVVPNMAELGDEELAKRLEADGRKLIERQEPTERSVQYLLMKLRERSVPRTQSMADLIEKRYPKSKASEMATVIGTLSKLGPDLSPEKAAPDVRNEVFSKLLDFLKLPGRTSEKADDFAVSYAPYIAHYTDVDSERLFEAVKLGRVENKLPLVRMLTDRKAHLPELEEMASDQIEKLIREVAAQSTIWHDDSEMVTFNGKFSWATLAHWDEALGWIYLQQDKLKEAEPRLLTAEKLLEMEIGIAPGKFIDRDRDALLHLGYLQIAKGNYAPAEEYLGRAMSQEYDYPDEHPAIAAFKKLYLHQHGNDQGMEKYLALANEKDIARRKKMILKERIADAKPIPAFKLTTVEGKTISSEELKGKVVVINFWGTWCGPCKYELPEVQKFHEKYKESPNVIFLTIDSKDSLEQVKKYLAEKKYTFPVLMEGDYLQEANVKGFPTTWFIDRDGKKAFEKVGASRRIVDEFSWRIEALLETPAVNKPTATKSQ